jgi:hypothetical protein
MHHLFEQLSELINENLQLPLAVKIIFKYFHFTGFRVLPRDRYITACAIWTEFWLPETFHYPMLQVICLGERHTMFHSPLP